MWWTGYSSPGQFIDILKSTPAPHWGLSAQLLRGVLDSLLIYFPVYLMGGVPPTPSFLAIFSSEQYYLTLSWLGPLVLLVILLLQAAVLHVLLRLLGYHSDIDRLINLIGMAALVVGAVLIPWDWAMFALGFVDQYLLGTTHLVISLWGVVLVTVGLRKLFSVPVGTGVWLSLLMIPIGLPFAVMFMRSPF
jgi:hypothetical protein